MMHYDIAFPAALGRKGERCLLTVLDDTSEYATVFPLATKGQAAEQIEQIIKDNERAGKKTRIVKSDRGGEFTGTAFVEHLRAKGIKVEHSPAGTPKSNARIERLHGTLFPMLRAVLHKQGLPLNLWPMMIDGIVYTYKRLPCAAIGGKIPFELWTGRPVPTLQHLRVLGCRCYYRDPKPDGKLAPRSTPAMLVGYASSGRRRTAVYKVWDAKAQRVIETADVVFDESPAGGITGTPGRPRLELQDELGDSVLAQPAAGEAAGAGNDAAAAGGAPGLAGAVPTVALPNLHAHVAPPLVAPGAGGVAFDGVDDAEHVHGQPEVGQLPELPPEPGEGGQVPLAQGGENAPEEPDVDPAPPVCEVQTAPGWRSGRTRNAPDRWGYPREAQAAEALQEVQQLPQEDLSYIAAYLGAAGEGVLNDIEAIDIRADPPRKYGEALHAASGSKAGVWAPGSRAEMLTRPDSDEFLQAESRELSGLIAKQVFQATWLPKGARMVRCMWV